MNYLPVRCAFPPWGKTGKGGVPFDCTHFPAHRPCLPLATERQCVKGAHSCAFNSPLTHWRTVATQNKRAVSRTRTRFRFSFVSVRCRQWCSGMAAAAGVTQAQHGAYLQKKQSHRGTCTQTTAKVTTRVPWRNSAMRRPGLRPLPADSPDTTRFVTRTFSDCCWSAIMLLH